MAKQFYRTIQDPKSFGKLMDQVRVEAARRLQVAPLVITITQVNKSREQEKKYHAQLKDIHEQAYPKSDFECGKALYVKWFADELEKMGEPLKHPGRRVWDHKCSEWVYVRPSTKDFSVKEGKDFIEFLYSEGAEKNVTWSEKAPDEYKDYQEMQKD